MNRQFSNNPYSQPYPVPQVNNQPYMAQQNMNQPYMVPQNTNRPYATSRGTNQPSPALQNREQPSQKQKPPEEKEGKWQFKDWLVKVIIPILSAPVLVTLITVISTANPAKPTPPVNPVSPSPSVSIVTLHPSYTGTAISNVNGVSVGLTLTNLHEDAQGNFQAAASAASSLGTCSGFITNGQVNADNQVTFKFQQQTSFNCSPVSTDFSGQVDSAGRIAGTWQMENTSSQGDFSLS